MAKALDMAYQTFTAGATGFICRYSSVLIKDGFTDWVFAGGIGIAGLFGATMGKNAVEKIGLGAVDGVASYVGVKMAAFVESKMKTPTIPVTPTTFGQGAIPAPRLIGLETRKDISTKPINTRKSVMEI